MKIKKEKYQNLKEKLKIQKRKKQHNTKALIKRAFVFTSKLSKINVHHYVILVYINF